MCAKRFCSRVTPANQRDASASPDWEEVLQAVNEALKLLCAVRTETIIGNANQLLVRQSATRTRQAHAGGVTSTTEPSGPDGLVYAELLRLKFLLRAEGAIREKILAAKIQGKP